MWNFLDLIFAKVSVQTPQNGLMTDDDHRVHRSLYFEDDWLNSRDQIQVALPSRVSVREFELRAFNKVIRVLFFNIFISHIVADSSVNLI
jgi:hypothetical protein